MRGVAAFVIIIIGMLTLSSIGLPLPVEAKSTTEPQWAMYRGDAKNTGLSSYDTSKNPGHLTWKYRAEDGIIGAPVIGNDGTIYFATEGIRLYAVKNDGTKKWHIKVNGTWLGKAPTIDSEGVIYFSTYTRDDAGYLFAVDPTGKVKWQLEFEGDPRSAPVIDRNNIIYTAVDQHLYAIYPNSTVYWKSKCWTLSKTGPTIADDGTIFYNQYVFDPDGTQKIRMKVGSTVNTIPVIGPDGTIYFGARDDNLYAVNWTGHIKWKFLVTTGIRFSPAIGPDGTIYFSSNDMNIHALSPEGRSIWSYRIMNQIVSSPLIGADGTIFISAYDLYAITPNGKVKWKYEAEDGVSSTPAIDADGQIYVRAYNRILLSIGNPGPDEISLVTIFLVLIVTIPVVVTILILHNEKKLYKRLGLNYNFKTQNKR